MILNNKKLNTIWLIFACKFLIDTQKKSIQYSILENVSFALNFPSPFGKIVQILLKLRAK